jgi:hypothetical protein
MSQKRPPEVVAVKADEAMTIDNAPVIKSPAPTTRIDPIAFRREIPIEPTRIPTVRTNSSAE